MLHSAGVFEMFTKITSFGRVHGHSTFSLESWCIAVTWTKVRQKYVNEYLFFLGSLIGIVWDTFCRRRQEWNSLWHKETTRLLQFKSHHAREVHYANWKAKLKSMTTLVISTAAWCCLLNPPCELYCTYLQIWFFLQTNKESISSWIVHIS